MVHPGRPCPRFPLQTGFRRFGGLCVIFGAEYVITHNGPSLNSVITLGRENIKQKGTCPQPNGSRCLLSTRGRAPWSFCARVCGCTHPRCPLGGKCCRVPGSVCPGSGVSRALSLSGVWCAPCLPLSRGVLSVAPPLPLPALRGKYWGPTYHTVLPTARGLTYPARGCLVPANPGAGPPGSGKCELPSFMGLGGIEPPPSGVF